MRHTIFLAASIFVISCQNRQGAPGVPLALNPVDTVPVLVLRDSHASKDIELPAELLPYEQAEIFARVEGYIRELKVDLGDRVRKGQTLALIEAPELHTKYAEYLAALQAARAKYVSSADLYARLSKAAAANTPGIVAPVELERSRNQYLADSASYEAGRQLAESYKQAAGYLVLQAPFDGVVTRRMADRGALVGTSQPILKIQHNRKLRLRMAIPEQYVSAGGGAGSVSFRVEAVPDKLFSATFSRRSESIDPVTRTEIWEYSYENASDSLKAGSFAYVKLRLQRTGNSFILPSSAVVTNQERRFIIRVKDGKASWVDVRIGMATERGVELFGDLHRGDTVVVRSTDERKPGSVAVWKVEQ